MLVAACTLTAAGVAAAQASAEFDVVIERYVAEGLRSYRRMAIARTLRRNITLAYVDWLKARNSVDIVASSESLLRENLRVNESLFDNGKITEDQVLRARAELLDVEQQKRDTGNLATQARSYFNFLLNRDLLSDIESSSAPNS